MKIMNVKRSEKKQTTNQWKGNDEQSKRCRGKLQRKRDEKKEDKMIKLPTGHEIKLIEWFIAITVSFWC